MTDKMYVDNIFSEDVFINLGYFSVINVLFALVEYLVDQFMSLSLPLSNIQHTVNYKHHRPNPRGSNSTFVLEIARFAIINVHIIALYVTCDYVLRV